MVFNITGIDLFEELRFIVELIAAELIFALPYYKKKEKFSIKFGIGIILLILFSLLFFPLKNGMQIFSFLNAYGIILPLVIITHYSILTVLTTVFLYTCFDYTFDQAILNTICGYSIQHISYVIFTELIARTWFTSISNYLFIYMAFALSGFALLLVLTYFVFVRKFKGLNSVSFQNSKKSAIHYTVILIVTVFLTFAGQTIYQNNGTTRIVENPNYLGAAVSLLTCGIIIFAIYLLYVENQKEKENEIVSQMFYIQSKQYDYKKETAEAFKRLSHDMKHQLLALKNGTNENAISSMEDTINNYDELLDTKNEALNILLYEKMLYSKQFNISIEFDGDATLLSFINASDLYVLLGNALDNSIEAILRDDNNQKTILLSIKEKKGIVSLVISNYFNGKINIIDGSIITIKEDRMLHGIGMASMKRIVEKYNGTLDYNIDNNIFTLKAIFTKN